MAPITVDMAAGAGDRLTMESIPAIDLRLLTQSELNALSRCSAHAVDLRRCDDVVIPKIDRSVFNESAGSRKQTYSRFRLARRKPDLSSKPLSLSPGPVLDDPERVENSKIIALFKQLFNADSQCAEIVPVNMEYSETFPTLSNFALSGDGGETRRKRGRKPKSEKLAMESASKALVVYDNREEKEKVIVNKNGVVVDLVELAKLEDPFAAEIRRRTVGMEKDEELLGFLTGFDGQWGSRRKRRKIVDANEFGDALPNGWKVLIGMKKRQGQCWLFCRRYISPNGRYFMSCKEVSSYLMSLCGLSDAKQLPLGHCVEASQVEHNLVSVNDETMHTKNQNAVSVSSVTFEPDDHGKKSTLIKDDHIGVLQDAGLFKCHKCSTPFYEKNHLLHHLISCHKRKRRKSGMPMEDDELLKEGHYECQFCNKRFTERVCFFGHVGIHVKNYVKSLEGSPGITHMQNGVSISSAGIPPPAILEKLECMEVDGDSVVCIPEIATSNELNMEMACSKLPAESDPKDHAKSGNDKVIMLPVDGDQVNTASRIDRGALEESADKGNAVPEMMDEDVGDAEKSTDTAGVNLVSCSGDENLRSSNGKNDTCQTSIEANVMEATGDRDTTESKVLVQNTVGLISVVEKSASLINSGNGFCSDRKDGHDEQTISGCELLDNDRSVNENTKARLTIDDVARPRYSEKLKHTTIDKEVMFGSDNIEIGQKINVVNDALQERSSTSYATVARGKEEIALPEFSFEMKSEQCSSAQDNLQRCAIEDDAKGVLIRASSGFNFGTSNSRENEMPFDEDSFNSSGRNSVFVLPGQEISNVALDDANTVSALKKLEPRKDDRSVNISSPSPIVVPREEQHYGTESSSLCKTSSIKEPKCEEIVRSTNLFNPKSSLDANLVTNKEVVKIGSSHFYSPLRSREAPNDSNAYGTCISVTEESEQERETFSSLSVGGHARCITGQIRHVRDNMNDNSSAPCATHLPDLGKVERSGVANKVILDFGNSMTDINSGVLPSFPPETIPASPCPFSLWNGQSFVAEQNHSRVCSSSREEAREDHGLESSSSLSLTSFQQTCNVGYNLNETYISTVGNLPRLNALETHRDTDLMIGFRNMNARPNQDVVSEALWRSNEGNALQSGVGDSSTSHGQLTGAFQPFDFLSDKGESVIFSVNEKFDSIANFGGLRSTPVEPMEFSFLTPQDSNPQLGDPKVLPYGNAGIEQGFESSVWLGKDASLPNMSTRNSFSTACVWCGSQFQQESMDSDSPAGSIGYLCPTCKARVSGQLL